MAHRNARLTVYGRRLIVQRVRQEGMAVAHVAKAMGISRQCAHRWVARWDEFGDPGLEDRSSRPHHSPTRTPSDVEDLVVAKRLELRVGQDCLADHLPIPPRTISRILRRRNVPYLSDCDPLTGDEVIRSSKQTSKRYEREHPGDLIHVDVKKIGRIPDGGGWRAWGRNMGRITAKNKIRIGYDYVHSAVDDHSRLAYSEIHNDEKGDTFAGFLTRAEAFFTSCGIPNIKAVMTDNHWSYTKSRAVADASSPMCRPGQGSCMWRSSLTYTAVESWDGEHHGPSRPAWHSMPLNKRSGIASTVTRPVWSITPTEDLNICRFATQSASPRQGSNHRSDPSAIRMTVRCCEGRPVGV